MVSSRRVATGTGSDKMNTASGAVLEVEQLGMMLLVRPVVVPVVAGLVITPSGSGSIGRSGSLGDDAAAQPKSAGKSMRMSPSSSRSFEHAGQLAPAGQVSVSSLSEMSTQPGSVG